MNAKELFNLHHAQARIVIEHIFRVLKNRFKILHSPPHHPLDLQVRIPVALSALHNFIRETNDDEGKIPTDPYQSAYTPFSPNIDGDHGFIGEDDDDVENSN